MRTGGTAFYARKGSRVYDFITLLHPPYTAWNMAYVAIGASLAPAVDWLRLIITLLAFFAGTGIASHALDELNGRPLKTGFSDRQLKLIAVTGLIVALICAIIGVWLISPVVLFFAVVGCFLVVGYTLEWWNGLVHTDIGFALSWGAFPIIVGYWAQTETISISALIVAGAATLLSLVQRNLSTPARFVRRRVREGGAVFKTANSEELWDNDKLLTTWEVPLKLLSWAVVILALGLLALRL